MRVGPSVRRSVTRLFNCGNWNIWQILQIRLNSICNSILVPSDASLFEGTCSLIFALAITEIKQREMVGPLRSVRLGVTSIDQYFLISGSTSLRQNQDPRMRVVPICRQEAQIQRPCHNLWNCSQRCVLFEGELIIFTNKCLKFTILQYDFCLDEILWQPK